MTGFRVLFAAIFATVVVYTIPVLVNHGFTLFGVFFGDMAKMEWAGQFNLDFLCMLVMSGSWLAWRNQFSAAGLALGLGGLFLGAPFLSAYLFVMSFRVGSVAELFLGPERARALTAA